MSKVNIVPAVKFYTDKKGRIKFRKLFTNEKLTDYQYELLKNSLSPESENELIFIKKDKLEPQAYEIAVNKKCVKCYYSDNQGKHNAILTLHQLLKNKSKLTTCLIKDRPDFEIRSVMIDISRNKVFTLQTLKEVIDNLALVKINDVQLYIEGRSFYFESMSKYYDNPEHFLTGSDVIELRKYANDRNIELTPNTNCFGHMAYWLNQKDLNHLAYKKDGFVWSHNGLRGYAQTIDPTNKQAKELVYTLFEDLLKYYPNTKYFTIGGDEPFELLFPEKDPNGKKLYEDHLYDVTNYVKDKNIIPCMWGDVIKEYPSMIEKFNDVLFLEWGYEAGHFNDDKCSFYKKHNKDFMVCCGTSSWLSISGRMDNMFKNYEEASIYGRKYNAKGFMITDWNDGAAFSQLVTLMACYIYGACYAYNSNVNKEVVAHFIDKNVYHSKLTDKVIELGRYNIKETISPNNMTRLFIMLYVCQIDGINIDINSYSDCYALFSRQDVLNYEECLKTKEFLDNWNLTFKENKANQYSKELMFSYRLIRHALNLNFAYIKLKNITCSCDEIKDLLKDINEIIDDYNKIWFKRNKESDFKYSLLRLRLLRKKYINLISIMEGDF